MRLKTLKPNKMYKEHMIIKWDKKKKSHTLEVGRYFKMNRNERKKYLRPPQSPVSELLDQSLMVHSN